MFDLDPDRFDEIARSAGQGISRRTLLATGARLLAATSIVGGWRGVFGVATAFAGPKNCTRANLDTTTQAFTQGLCKKADATLNTELKQAASADHAHGRIASKLRSLGFVADTAPKKSVIAYQNGAYRGAELRTSFSNATTGESARLVFLTGPSGFGTAAVVFDPSGDGEYGLAMDQNNARVVTVPRPPLPFVGSGSTQSADPAGGSVMPATESQTCEQCDSICNAVLNTECSLITVYECTESAILGESPTGCIVELTYEVCDKVSEKVCTLTCNPYICGCPANEVPCGVGTCCVCPAGRDPCGLLTCCCTTGYNECGRICCPGALTCCDGECVAQNFDHEHCGNCASAACGADEACCAGQCVSCATPETCNCCAGTPTDIQTDPNNCGECGNHCFAGQSCVDGHCYGCQTGYEICGPPEDYICCNTAANSVCCNKQCVQKSTLCAEGGSACCVDGQTCNDGTCTCDSGVLCGSTCCAANEMCCDGTCTDVTSDPANCKTCGNTCPSGQECCSGTCSDLTDSSNCGACGTVCPPSQTCYTGGWMGPRCTCNGYGCPRPDVTCQPAVMCVNNTICCGMSYISPLNGAQCGFYCAPDGYGGEVCVQENNTGC